MRKNTEQWEYSPSASRVSEKYKIVLNRFTYLKNTHIHVNIFIYNIFLNALTLTMPFFIENHKVIKCNSPLLREDAQG